VTARLEAFDDFQRYGAGAQVSDNQPYDAERGPVMAGRKIPRAGSANLVPADKGAARSGGSFSFVVSVERVALPDRRWHAQCDSGRKILYP
jgi:hypothetical protein